MIHVQKDKVLITNEIFLGDPIDKNGKTLGAHIENDEGCIPVHIISNLFLGGPKGNILRLMAWESKFWKKLKLCFKYLKTKG